MTTVSPLPRRADELMVGDILQLPDRDVVLTGVAETADGIVVRSGTWTDSYTRTWPVTAAPGRRRLARLAAQADTVAAVTR